MKGNHVVTRFEQCVERLIVDNRYQFGECFDNFLNLFLSSFCNNPNDQQQKIWRYMCGNANFRKSYTDALDAYSEMTDDYADPLGDLFMCRVSHGEKGQFFTPSSLIELMNKITDTGNAEGETIYDPACGSGRTVLNALKCAREKGCEPDINANDISMMCAKMTLCNLLTNSAGGIVTCGDALRLNWDDFVFFKIDRIRNCFDGKVLSTYWQYTTATVDEVEEQRRQWYRDILLKGWVKYRRISATETPEIEPITTDPEQLTTTPQFGQQLTLF